MAAREYQCAHWVAPQCPEKPNGKAILHLAIVFCGLAMGGCSSPPSDSIVRREFQRAFQSRTGGEFAELVAFNVVGLRCDKKQSSCAAEVSAKLTWRFDTKPFEGKNDLDMEESAHLIDLMAFLGIPPFPTPGMELDVLPGPMLLVKREGEWEAVKSVEANDWKLLKKHGRENDARFGTFPGTRYRH